jgi:hypothetical protein
MLIHDLLTAACDAIDSVSLCPPEGVFLAVVETALWHMPMDATPREIARELRWRFPGEAFVDLFADRLERTA